MDQLQAELEPMLELLRHHCPPELLSNALAGAAVAGMGGLILALWGARLLRPAMMLTFAVGGVFVGLAGNQWLGLGQWFCLITGVLVFGALGFVLFRLWVGVGWATLLVCAALSILGYRQAWPHWEAFNESRWSPAVLAEAPFQPPSVEEQASFNDPDPAVVFQEFGSYLTEKVPHIRRNALAIIGLLGVVGLLMGLLAVRFTTILASSVIGVALLGGAVGYGLSRFHPATLEQALSRPAALWAGLGLTVVLSIAIQWFQIRPGKPPEAGGARSGKN